ncbi:MAG: signal recognition particle-docking protein FtsY [Methanomicrobiales archaeon]|nr:signal recognition particle-docking protein FtsY [Methanomicrobiales archaeon]
MFDSLRNGLRAIRGRLSASISVSAVEGTQEPQAEEGPEQRQKEVKPGLVKKVKTFVLDQELFISEKEISGALEELELLLLESDVALPVVDHIVAGLRRDLTGKRRRIGSDVDEIVASALAEALVGVLGEGFDLIGFIRGHERPVKILFTGVNGTGKTTTIAKVGAYLKNHGFSVVIGSGDTFRAGALEQMATHASRVGIRVIQHQQGADPSAVLFDAVQHAIANGIDVVLGDTAGRFHNKANLMNQLEKVKRVMRPDLIVYVDEAVAGNDAVVRADEFNRLVGTDAVILTKADMDMKGGAAISIAHTIGKPILFLGTGQGYQDLLPFSPGLLVKEIIGEGAKA